MIDKYLVDEYDEEMFGTGYYMKTSLYIYFNPRESLDFPFPHISKLGIETDIYSIHQIPLPDPFEKDKSIEGEPIYTICDSKEVKGRADTKGDIETELKNKTVEVVREHMRNVDFSIKILSASEESMVEAFQREMDSEVKR